MNKVLLFSFAHFITFVGLKRIPLRVSHTSEIRRFSLSLNNNKKNIFEPKLHDLSNNKIMEEYSYFQEPLTVNIVSSYGFYMISHSLWMLSL